MIKHLLAVYYFGATQNVPVMLNGFPWCYSLLLSNFTIFPGFLSDCRVWVSLDQTGHRCC